MPPLGPIGTDTSEPLRHPDEGFLERAGLGGAWTWAGTPIPGESNKAAFNARSTDGAHEAESMNLEFVSDCELMQLGLGTKWCRAVPFVGPVEIC